MFNFISKYLFIRNNFYVVIKYVKKNIYIKYI